VLFETTSQAPPVPADMTLHASKNDLLPVNLSRAAFCSAAAHLNDSGEPEKSETKAFINNQKDTQSFTDLIPIC
jgi:hypothetical protein